MRGPRELVDSTALSCATRKSETRCGKSTTMTTGKVFYIMFEIVSLSTERVRFMLICSQVISISAFQESLL